MASWFLTIIVCCRKKKSEADETICWYPICLILFRGCGEDVWFFEMIEWLSSRIFIKISAKGVMLDNRFNIPPEFPSPDMEFCSRSKICWWRYMNIQCGSVFRVPEVYLSCEQWFPKWLEGFFFLNSVELSIYFLWNKNNFKLLLCIYTSTFKKSTLK